MTTIQYKNDYLNKTLAIIVFMMLLVPLNIDAQRKSGRNKGTSKREIRKRQEEANKKATITNSMN